MKINPIRLLKKLDKSLNIAKKNRIEQSFYSSFLTVSSVYSNDYLGDKINDGNQSTVWGSSVSDKSPEVIVDLTTMETVNGIGLYWFDQYFPKTYTIYTSEDSKVWTFQARILKNSNVADIFTENISVTNYLSFFS